MSKEEKMFIIEMVRDGKITSEQGVELLNALERSAEQLKIPSDVNNKASDEVQREEELVEELVEEKIEKMGETIEAIAENLASKAENVFLSLIHI